MEPMNKHEEPEDLGEEPVRYMGHVGCWDPHMSERLADEADWEQEREEDALREVEVFLAKLSPASGNLSDEQGRAK